MNKRFRTVLLLLLLLVVAATLTSCGVPQGDINLDDPSAGPFNVFLVYPLVKFLILLSKTISGLGIPYSYGWAIIVLTALVKLVTLPLTLKQLHSSKAMMQLQPRMRELQALYGKDRLKLSEEQNKLYKEVGISPLSGCLPMLIQMPVMIALYQALFVLANPSIGQLQGAGFFWVKDLAFPDMKIGPSWIQTSIAKQDWGTLISYLSLPILILISSYLQQKMSQQPKDPKGTSDPQAQIMSSMTVFMPLMFGYFSLTMPSGLSVYWFVNTILTGIPQYFVTGWGGLVDWFPMLKGKESGQQQMISKATHVKDVPANTQISAQPATSAEPVKPVKRNRRRR